MLPKHSGYTHAFFPVWLPSVLFHLVLSVALRVLSSRRGFLVGKRELEWRLQQTALFGYGVTHKPSQNKSHQPATITRLLVDLVLPLGIEPTSRG